MSAYLDFLCLNLRECFLILRLRSSNILTQCNQLLFDNEVNTETEIKTNSSDGHKFYKECEGKKKEKIESVCEIGCSNL